DHGQTGLSVAFDLPTQIGYDSDHRMAHGEVGKVGVAIDSLRDMEVLLADLPIERISTSMTINATAALLLLLYQVVAEQQGCPPEKITGTVQNDILKEYAARGTYIYPPKASMRLTTDLFAYCRDHLPSWNTISISGYHIREAGATAAAAARQRGQNLAGGAQRGPRRHPVTSHQRLRRGPRPPLRAGGRGGPADPAGDRLRDRRP